MKAGTLSPDPQDGRKGSSGLKPEAADPQPSTSGMNGAVVHAGTRGRENFLRPDLQRDDAWV